MARGAAAVQRRVRELLLDFLLHVDMTHKAKIGAVLNEQTPGIRLMRIMAGGAVPRGRGTVDELIVCLVGVA